MTLTGTRDNYIRHALETGACPCPDCGRLLAIGETITCPCGFAVGKEELDRHKASETRA